MSVTYTADGVTYIRTGKCTRCGQCCYDCQCPHLLLTHKKTGKEYIQKIEGIKPNSPNIFELLKPYQATCLIRGREKEFCAKCDNTHEPCIIGIDHPFVKYVVNGTCGFKFEVVK